MAATNTGYAGVRITSGTSVPASGNFVNFPVVASTSPRRRYPSWSLHSIVQSGLWYQMKKMPWSAARTHTIQSDRRDDIFTILVQQLAIQALDIVDEAVERVARRDRLASGVSHAAAPSAIAEQRDHVVGERARVPE